MLTERLTALLMKLPSSTEHVVHLVRDPEDINWQIPVSSRWQGPYNATTAEWHTLAHNAATMQNGRTHLFDYNVSAQADQGSLFSTLKVESGCLGTRPPRPTTGNPIASGDIVLLISGHEKPAEFFIIK